MSVFDRFLSEIDKCGDTFHAELCAKEKEAVMGQFDEDKRREYKKNRALHFAEERMDLLDTIRMLIREEIAKYGREVGKSKKENTNSENDQSASLEEKHKEKRPICFLRTLCKKAKKRKP